MKRKINYDLRMDRVQQQILEALGRLIHSEVKDPGVSELTSVLRVEVTNDLKYAKVYVTTYGDGQARENAMAGLNRAKGFLRSRLARILETRTAPELTFVNDDSIEYAAFIQKTLDGLNIPPEETEEVEETDE